MHSKNKRPMDAAERAHIDRLRRLPCSVCNRCGPSEAHEVEQGLWFTSIALCAECHRGPVMGWHGERRAWAIAKMTLLQALNITIRRLVTLPPVPSAAEVYL